LTRHRALIAGGVVVVAVVVAVLMFAGLPRWRGRPPAKTASAAPAAAPAAPGRKIKARLFYVAEDGLRLTEVERDVAYGEGTLEQARAIITAQIAPVAEPLVSAVPAGTTLRALFIAERGEAYVDLSPEVVSAHPGGTLSEALTVYTLVHALTANLPAVTAVQVLVDGKEVDTLAGHIDLRRPLAKNLAWVR
jgi:spore germination protein GerM